MAGRRESLQGGGRTGRFSDSFIIQEKSEGDGAARTTVHFERNERNEEKVLRNS